MLELMLAALPENLRLVIVGLVPFGMLPWVLGRVKSVISHISHCPQLLPQSYISCQGTHPSSAGVMASTLRPNRCQYQAVVPIAKAVAPMGRALLFRAVTAPSAEVDAARYIIQFVSQCINCGGKSSERYDIPRSRSQALVCPVEQRGGLPGVVP